MVSWQSKEGASRRGERLTVSIVDHSCSSKVGKNVKVAVYKHWQNVYPGLQCQERI